MVNKELKSNIKKTQVFISLWVKFHDLYNKAAKKGAITREEEKIFRETKSLLSNKYEALKHALNINRSQDSEMMDVISHVLSLKGMEAMSDKELRKIERNWEHSHVFLNKILKTLEKEGRELAKKKPVVEFSKVVFSGKLIQFAALVIVVFIMMLGLNILIYRLVK